MSSVLLVAIAVAIQISGVTIYVRNMLKGRAQPHAYTWLVWMLTQSIGVLGSWQGGGGAGAVPLMTGLVGVTLIFFFSLKYGTKNVTRLDGVFLCAAFVSIGIWVFLKNPLLAVLMASAIDFIGFMPTYRKAWQEPWSEPVVTWGLNSFGNICALFALQTFSLLTASYLSAVFIGNFGITILCSIRRMYVKRPRRW